MFNRIISFIGSYFYALLSCLFMFTFGLFSGKNRDRIFSICKIFGYKPNLTAIPKIRLSELVPGNIAVQILEPDGVPGNIAPLEIIAIVQLIRYSKPKMLFEIGTFDGRTTLNMGANSPEDAKIYTLDLPRDMIDNTKLAITSGEKRFIDKKASGLRFHGTEWGNKITQLYGDSATFDFSQFLDKMDFVFVDGSHSYEYVVNDSKMAVKLVKNGIIVWHDYSVWRGVSKALDELYSRSDDFKSLRHIQGTSLVYMQKGA